MMSKNPFLEGKKKRFEDIKKIVKSMDGEEYKKVVAATEIGTGLSRGKVVDYLKTLENFGFLEIKDKRVYKKSTTDKTHSSNNR